MSVAPSHSCWLINEGIQIASIEYLEFRSVFLECKVAKKDLIITSNTRVRRQTHPTTF